LVRFGLSACGSEDRESGSGEDFRGLHFSVPLIRRSF
jgi:hypothetical protein